MEPERNIDHAEIDRFDELADAWWDVDGPFSTLHALNPFRVEYVSDRRALRGLHVLDVGCGGGILSEGLAARGAVVTGLDASSALVALAREHASARGLRNEYVEATIEELADEGGTQFDVITCMEMLEHVPDPASVIDACARLLKPGGDLFLSSINRTPKAWLLAIAGAEYVLRLLPRGTHHYERLLRPSELARWLRESGLGIRSIDGFTYNPLTGRFRLTRRSDVNYFIHAAKPE